MIKDNRGCCGRLILPAAAAFCRIGNCILFRVNAELTGIDFGAMLMRTQNGFHHFYNCDFGGGDRMKNLERWMNRTFGRRIMMFFVPVIIMLILTTVAVSGRIYYTSMLENSQKNIKGAVKQGNYIIDLYFQDIKTTAVLLSDSDELRYMLTNFNMMSIPERFYTQEQIDKVLRNTSLMRDHIQDCIVVGNNGYQTNMPDRPEIKTDTDILKEEWMRPVIEGNGGFFYTGAHQADYYYVSGDTYRTVLSVVLPVVEYGKCLGYIIIDLDFQKMNEIVTAGNEVEGLRYLVADHEGNIVFSDEPGEISTALPEEAVKELADKEAFFLQFGEREMFCVHGESGATRWEFLGLVERENILRPMLWLRNVLIFIILPVFIAIAFGASVMIARKVKKPLEEIAEQLEQIDVDNPEPFRVKNSVGEIEYLAGKITEMSQRIIYLAGLVYRAEIKRKDAQIEALISQINPHFLYNTLQLIKTESVRGRPREVGDTVNCLSRFLRYTINNRERKVRLSEELEHIRVYMEIYKKRFPDKYTLMIYEEEGTGEILVPKLILQPIVENAIKHGLSKKSRPGIITVTAKNGRDLTVVIEDDGIGMEEESLGELFGTIHRRENTGTHIGLCNIQERLELDGGGGYGIVGMESKEGNGFKVTMKIKKEWDNV